jgi:hypothetical protein
MINLFIDQLINLFYINQPILTVKELLNSINYEYNNIFLDKFWQNIKDDIWIYIDDNMLKYIGYNCERERDSKKKYLNTLTENFEVNLDFKILNSSEFKNFYSTVSVAIENKEFNDHNKAKHLIVSPDCFKQSLMLLKTSKSKEIKKYYIELERVFKFYLEYQNEYRKLELENKQNELEEKENIINKQKEEIKDVNERIVDLSHHLFKYKELKENTYLYVATNKHLSLQNNYKIGVSTQLTKRLINYNSNNNINDRFYYTYVKKVHNAYTVEYIIKYILKEFKNANSNEIYILNHDYLVQILDNLINNYNNIISYYNLLMKDYIVNLKNNSINNSIPQAININQYQNINYQEEPENNQSEQSTTIENEATTLYYNNNSEYVYLKYRNENNKFLFKCLHCNYIFNRIDNLQNHFNRQVKCYETPEYERIQNIKKQNDNPIILTLEQSDKYTYYEKYNEENKKIEYYCNNCSYKTDNLNILKKHYIKRQIKCYDEIKPSNEFIYKDTNNKEHKYFKLQTNIYKCSYCDYTASKANVIRHFMKKIKCYEKLETKILKEIDNMKYYLIYKDNIKQYKCFHCDYTTSYQHSLSRHYKSSINSCH